MKKQFVIFYFFLICSGLYAQDIQVMSLAGQWRFAPDSASVGTAGQWFKRELPKNSSAFSKGYGHAYKRLDKIARKSR